MPGASRPRIGFASFHAPDDVHAQSGIPWHTWNALDRYVGSVEHFGPLRPWIARPLRIASRLSRSSRRWRFIDTNSKQLSVAYGRLLSKKLAASDVGWLFGQFASAELAHLETDKPIIYQSDTTFRTLCDYYPAFTGLSARVRRAGDELEARAIERATFACYASEWAANSAIRDYGAAPEKVRVLQMPANLTDPPVRDTLRFERAPGPLRLLFIGVDWARKGGPIAFEALLALRQLGIDAELTVVGCTPPAPYVHPQMRVLGFVSKRDASGPKLMERLFRESDLFLLPTRAECYGCVFAEAAAFAVPSITTDTGGVRSAMAGGASGLLLPLDAGGTDYARAIADAVADDDRYRAMRISARDAFERELSWDVWAQRVNELTMSFR
jgi:glycosyltransferase involved in cell wall biosynthesis